MRNYFGFAIVIAILGITVYSISESQRMKLEVMLSKKENALLQDQCRDYEYKLSTITPRSYDDGYRDAVRDSENGGVFNKGYTAGYHSAIQQNICPLPDSIRQNQNLAQEENKND